MVSFSKVMLKKSSGVDVLSISIAGPMGSLNGMGSLNAEPVAEVLPGEFNDPFWG